MKTKDALRVGVIVPGLVLALLLNPLAYGTPQQSASTQTDVQSQSTEATQSPTPHGTSTAAPPASTQPESTQPSDDQLPDSPGAVQSQSVQSASQPPSPSQAQQATQEQPQNRPHEPVGTAAAESVPTSGVAASRPAGAALAPAKQRRVRSILIKVGAAVGVGVAVGATMALSQGSPSKPPGSH